MSENRLMLARVTANYFGLFVSLAIGIILTRELIQVLGEDGFGLVSLFGTTAGIGVMIQDIVKQTMIRELGYALHHQDADFKATQADAFGVSAVVALLTAVVFGLLWLLVPLFKVPDPLIDAARWFIVAKALQSIAFVLAAPLYNLYLITERMVLANALIVFERLAMLGCIIGVGLYASGGGIGEKLVLYGFLSAAAISLVTAGSAIALAVFDAKLRPDLRRMSADGVKSLFKQSMVQGTAVTAVNLHARVDGFIVNSFVGLAGNMAYGLGFQFASYIRRVAVGMTQGLDAVSARLSAGVGDRDVRWLLRRSTQMHAAVIFPIGAFAIAFTPSLIDLWVGDLIADNQQVRALIIPSVIVLCVAMSARALSDAWIRILYGAGKVRRYLLPVVIASLANPVLAIVLSITLPHDYVVIGAPLAMSMMFLVVHCGWIGVIIMRELEASAKDMVAPLIGPIVGTTVAMIACLGVASLVPDGKLRLLVGALVFGAAYTALAGVLVLNPHQRRMIARRLKRRSTT